MEEKKDIFDRLMSLPGLRLLEPFYRKHREVLLYLLFGGLTTVVSVLVYGLFTEVVRLHVLVANVISWVAAVTFAYLTNRAWVFGQKPAGAKATLVQMAAFYGGRLATLGVEELILLTFITWLGLPGMAVKLAAQVVIVILNYVVSKLFVFRKNKSEEA